MGQLRDGDVRQAVHQKVLRAHLGCPNTLVLDELGLSHGSARVDIAVINGQIHGYEIKSDKDTLVRLPNQIEVYSAVLDRVTLVVGKAHIDEAMTKIPSWWGVVLATKGSRNAVNLQTQRSAQKNPNINLYEVASLLWRDEALELLEEHGISKGLRSKPRHVLYQCLVERLGERDLRQAIRQRLRDRHAGGDWRSA